MLFHVYCTKLRGKKKSGTALFFCMLSSRLLPHWVVSYTFFLSLFADVPIEAFVIPLIYLLIYLSRFSWALGLLILFLCIQVCVPTYPFIFLLWWASLAFIFHAILFFFSCHFTRKEHGSNYCYFRVSHKSWKLSLKAMQCFFFFNHTKSRSHLLFSATTELLD